MDHVTFLANVYIQIPRKLYYILYISAFKRKCFCLVIEITYIALILDILHNKMIINIAMHKEITS